MKVLLGSAATASLLAACAQIPVWRARISEAPLSEGVTIVPIGPPIMQGFGREPDTQTVAT